MSPSSAASARRRTSFGYADVHVASSLCLKAADPDDTTGDATAQAHVVLLDDLDVLERDELVRHVASGYELPAAVGAVAVLSPSCRRVLRLLTRTPLLLRVHDRAALGAVPNRSLAAGVVDVVADVLRGGEGGHRIYT